MVDVRIAGKKYWIVQHPDALKYIFSEHPKAFTKHGITKILRYFFGEGLVTSNDEAWAQKRKLVQPSFHKKQLSKSLGIIQNETGAFIKKLNGFPPNSEVNVNQELLALNVAIVFRALFGTSLDHQIDEMLHILQELNQFATKWMRSPIKIPLNWPTASNRKFHQNCRQFDAIIYKVIRERREGKAPKSDDLLSTLMHYKNAESGEGMSDRQLRDEVTTIFMAGHDTTSQTLGWILYELALNPSISQKIRVELNKTQDPRPFTADTLQQFTYTNQVIKEGLRHYPAISAVMRKPKKEVELNDIRIGPSANFLINIYGMHHHPDYWGHPEKFDPERFTIEADKNRPSFVFFPFGGGPRYCIGSGFAMMTMQVVLLELVKNFDFDVPAGFQPEIEPNITLKAKGGIRLMIQKVNFKDAF
ncbi:hypothetical protein Musp01_02720 [Muricauda sp. NBRC 101325]|nr:hypothetical protein Musp01_02720 [Muricauda sp. NBRC 101325]